tara:strand:+ start:7643 stop:7945 length:303 start_codon:yes stop_codon:yes gene_type:complete
MINITDLHNRLVQELNIENLPPHDQEKILDQAGSMIYQRILLAVFQNIPTTEHDKLKQFVAADLEDEITELVHKHVPQAEEIIEKEMTSSVQELKEILGV